jgi:cytochrome P450
MANDDVLAHILHLPAKPFIGHTKDALDDFLGLVSRSTEECGEIYRVKLLGNWRIHFTSPEAAEYILMDPDKNFSSEKGWADTMSQLFPRGLMLRDFDDHRQHRRIMQAAFRKPALDSYLALMAPDIDRLVGNWPVNESFAFHPAIKDLTLRMGANVFMGLSSDDPDAALLNDAFRDQIVAAVTVIRKPLPFTPFRKGLKARKVLVQRFRALVEERRNGDGSAFFTRMCQAKDEDGKGWGDAEIIEHFNFMMMAAHDTTASVLTTMAWALTEHPEWQERLLEEVAALPEGPMTPEMADQMPLTEMVMKEALRLIPPVPLFPRVALHDFEWNGVKIPAGYGTTVNVTMVMRSTARFTDPDKFDPDRFSPERVEDRSHRFAWVPFGGGAHKCIGMHFATMQVKGLIRALLSNHRIERTTKGPVDWKRLPTARPKGGLPVKLIPLS